MKAIVLYSGGLDSTLALKLIKEQGAEVFPLFIRHQFLPESHLPKLKNLKTIDVTEEMIEIVKSPHYGYGKNLNPCIDCRILMLQKAKRYLTELKADFVVTGEVLDQRPMSQRMEILMLIEKKAGLEGLVVRPLSGGLLPPTIPEKKGLIDRGKLLKLRGRSRRIELALAKEKNIKEFFSPGGGCLLTDTGFSRRLADLMRYEGEITPEDIHLLKLGRHFRLGPNTRLVVGREEEENKKLEKLLNSKAVLLYVPNTGSPNALLLGSRDLLKTAARVIARYSDKRKESIVEVCYKEKGKINKVKVQPCTDEELNKWRVT
ncbi:MAG: tRNA 4-thiouridine(8) synthase ThiI [candidate division WOR-3 bacterium]